MKKYGKQYPEVWTKEPHGGAYHKVRFAAGKAAPLRPREPVVFTPRRLFVESRRRGLPRLNRKRSCARAVQARLS